MLQNGELQTKRLSTIRRSTLRARLTFHLSKPQIWELTITGRSMKPCYRKQMIRWSIASIMVQLEFNRHLHQAHTTRIICTFNSHLHRSAQAVTDSWTRQICSGSSTTTPSSKTLPYLSQDHRIFCEIKTICCLRQPSPNFCKIPAPIYPMDWSWGQNPILQMEQRIWRRDK